ncbi:MAG TPA: sulfatase [Solirubrobacterales bacterium]
MEDRRAKRAAARRVVPVMALAVLAGGTWAAARTHSEAADRAAASGRPNVLVIETDDQTLESMKVMHSVNSLIGAHGATFTNSFVNYSLCCPSRATFLTGQYAHNHGVLSNKGARGGFPRFEALHAHNNLAVWLKNAGYHTALIGKYLNRYANHPPVPPGWSEWQAAAPDDQGVYDYTLNQNGDLVHLHNKPADFKQDVLTRRAVSFVHRRARQPQPFFLWLTYTAPHVGYPEPSPNPPHNCAGAAKPPPRYSKAFANAPLPMPPNFNEADVSDKPASIQKWPLLTSDQILGIRRKYRCELESLLSVDEGVKSIVSALRASNQLDDTLIVYTSDNGFFHGEHRLPEGKMRPYEESIRVPLEMRGPGVPSGVKVNPPVINADLAPTIVDAANATARLPMDGRSLLPVARRPGIARNRQLLIEEPGELAGVQAWGPGFEAIRTPDHIYVETRGEDPELYDLKRDPFELQNVAGHPAYASLRATLAARLHKLERCAGRSCRPGS